MQQLIEILLDKNITIGSVESFTVGNFATMVGSFPGVSKIFRGSIVSYHNDIKHQVVGVPNKIIEEYGVISKEVACAMAQNGKRLLDVDVCVSFTGNAGPNVMENKPVGNVFIAIMMDTCSVYNLQLSGNRNEIQQQAINFAVNKIKEKISN